MHVFRMNSSALNLFAVCWLSNWAGISGASAGVDPADPGYAQQYFQLAEKIAARSDELAILEKIAAAEPLDPNPAGMDAKSVDHLRDVKEQQTHMAALGQLMKAVADKCRFGLPKSLSERLAPPSVLAAAGAGIHAINSPKVISQLEDVLVKSGLTKRASAGLSNWTVKYARTPIFRGLLFGAISASAVLTVIDDPNTDAAEKEALNNLFDCGSWRRNGVPWYQRYRLEIAAAAFLIAIGAYAFGRKKRWFN
jgi:hypothetical protein